MATTITCDRCGGPGNLHVSQVKIWAHVHPDMDPTYPYFRSYEHSFDLCYVCRNFVDLAVLETIRSYSPSKMDQPVQEKPE